MKYLITIILLIVLTSCTIAKRITKSPYPGIAKLTVGYIIIKSIKFKQ